MGPLLLLPVVDCRGGVGGHHGEQRGSLMSGRKVGLTCASDLLCDLEQVHLLGS